MKITFLRNTALAAALVTGLTLTSCKDKETETTTETETIETTEGMNESPIDTIVTEDDTIIDTGDARTPNENPAGDQTP